MKLVAFLSAPLFSLFALSTVEADSAVWNLRASSPGWNVATNWTPNTVPNGPSDTATFKRSRETALSFSAATEVNSIIFNPEASAFTLTINTFGAGFTISGVGVTNNSGIVQNLVVSVGLPTPLSFTNSATAGSLIVITNKAGTSDFSYANQTFFRDSSSAAQSKIINEGSEFNDVVGGSTQFLDNSTAGNATVTNKPGQRSGTHNAPGNGGTTFFFDSSSAGNGIFASPGGGFFYFGGAETVFYGTSSAAQATFICGGAPRAGTASGSVTMFDSASAETANFTANGGGKAGAMGGYIHLYGTTTAANGMFILNGGAVANAGGGFLQLHESALASNATLVAKSEIVGAEGGHIDFLDVSDGGTVEVKLFGTGSLNLSSHNSPGITIGSLEGDGMVFLGPNNLTVGSNNLSKTFSGNMTGTGGSLSKIGSGMLTLGGANAYAGGTTINGGKLLVQNRTGSGTGSGPVQVNAGRLGGKGTIAGAVEVGTGSGPGAVLSPGKSGVRTGTLTILSTLTFSSDATYEVALNSEAARTDEVIANGVTINSGAQFFLADSQSSALMPGTVFTVIGNTAAATPIAGTFSNLADGSTVTAGSNNFQADYEGGDGNDLTLTVVP